MKRLFSVVLLVCMSLLLGSYSTAREVYASMDQGTVRLSSLDKEQCITFLSDYGIVIPKELSNIDVQEIIADIEADPDMPCTISYSVATNLVENIRRAVNSYYGRTNSTNAEAEMQYTLQYSTLYSWNSSTMPQYNCYAYALGRSSACNPGDFSGQSYNDKANISTVANLVKDDLRGQLGQSCVKTQTTRPSSTTGWGNVIAVRKDTTGDYYGFNDYHFAKLSSSSWYHKPGPTGILKFNSAPSNSVNWTNECYNGTYHEPSIWYESSIIYLLYKSNHGSTSYTWTGNDYHSGSRHYYQYGYKCNDCGIFTSTTWTNKTCSGPPCITPWSITPEPEES